MKKIVVDDDFRFDGESKTIGEFNINNIIAEHAEPQEKSGDGVLLEIGDEESVVQIEREIKLFEKLDSNNTTVQDFEHGKGSSEGGLPLGNIGESHIIDKMNVVVDNSPFASSTEAANSLSEGLIRYLIQFQLGNFMDQL